MRRRRRLSSAGKLRHGDNRLVLLGEGQKLCSQRARNGVAASNVESNLRPRRSYPRSSTFKLTTGLADTMLACVLRREVLKDQLRDYLASSTAVRREIIFAFMKSLRLASLDVVETHQRWSRNNMGLHGVPSEKRFVFKGGEQGGSEGESREERDIKPYLACMMTDLNFLSNHPRMIPIMDSNGEALSFENNPFFIAGESLNSDINDNAAKQKVYAKGVHGRGVFTSLHSGPSPKRLVQGPVYVRSSISPLPDPIIKRPTLFGGKITSTGRARTRSGRMITPFISDQELLRRVKYAEVVVQQEVRRLSQTSLTIRASALNRGDGVGGAHEGRKSHDTSHFWDRTNFGVYANQRLNPASFDESFDDLPQPLLHCGFTSSGFQISSEHASRYGIACKVFQQSRRPRSSGDLSSFASSWGDTKLASLTSDTVNRRNVQMRGGSFGGHLNGNQDMDDNVRDSMDYDATIHASRQSEAQPRSTLNMVMPSVGPWVDEEAEYDPSKRPSATLECTFDVQNEPELTYNSTEDDMRMTTDLYLEVTPRAEDDDNIDYDRSITGRANNEGLMFINGEENSEGSHAKYRGCSDKGDPSRRTAPERYQTETLPVKLHRIVAPPLTAAPKTAKSSISVHSGSRK